MPYKIRSQKDKESTPSLIASRGEAAIEKTFNRPQWVWGFVVLIVLIGVITLTMQSSKRGEEEAAWSLEAEASKFHHEPAPLPKPIEEGEEDTAPLEIMDQTARLKKAAEIYEEILSKYPKSTAAKVALFESGNVYTLLSMDDKAYEQYVSLIEKYPDSLSLSVLSHLRLAYLEQKKGNQSAAIDRFRMAYEMPESASKDQAGFELARALEVNGKADEAKTLYQKLSEDYAKTPWGVEAKARLLLLSPTLGSSGTSSEPESSTEPASDKTPE